MIEGVKHPNDMEAGELREIVFEMASLALDLGQHLRVTLELLKDEYKEEAYKRATQMAYDLSFYPYSGKRMEKGNVEIGIVGEKGMGVIRGDAKDLLKL